MKSRKELLEDPRLLEARRLLEEVLAEERQSMDRIKPADEDLKAAYENMCSEMAELRGGGLWYPYLGTGMGRNAHVVLADGSVKLDMITGIGVHVLGHMSKSVLDAHFESLLISTIQQGHLQQSVDAQTCLRLFLSLANREQQHFAHGILSSSGAMANENALKLAFQHRPAAQRVLAFQACFHGRSLAMASITDKALYRKGLPLACAVDYIPFFDPDAAQKSTDRAVKKLRTLIQRYPDQHAVMVMELIQGEGGFRTAPREFFVALMDVLKEANIGIWVDEIQTFGRTEQPFAAQSLDLMDRVDLLTVGKMTQVCATIYRAEYKPQAGLISQTFTSSSASICACNRILESFDRNVFEGEDEMPWWGRGGRIEQVRTWFEQAHAALMNDHSDRLGPLLGRGGMLAFQVGRGDVQETKAFLQACFDKGLLAFMAGAAPARVRFLPPLWVIKKEDVDEAYAVLSTLLKSFDVAEEG